MFSNETKVGAGALCGSIFTGIFLILLKLFEPSFDWSWFAVLMPFWLGSVIMAVVLVAVVVGFVWIIIRLIKSRRK